MMEEGMYEIQYGGTCYGDEPPNHHHHHQQQPPPLIADGGYNHHPDHREGFPAGSVVYGPGGGPWMQLQPGSSSAAVSDAASGMVLEAGEEDSLSVAMARAKIAAHPLYPKLLQAYIDCQKVGAPAEVADVLERIRRENEDYGTTDNHCLGADPELDEFMEAYHDTLMRYKTDLSRPFEEATSFLKKIENQLNTLCSGSSTNCASGRFRIGRFNLVMYTMLARGFMPDRWNPSHIIWILVYLLAFKEHACCFTEGSSVADIKLPVGTDDNKEYCCTGDSSEDDDLSGGEIDTSECYRTREDRELMDKLMRKYSGYISALKHEFSKKKKRGKLPKQARDILLEWWNVHYKWPYPTEVDKVALAESTGLDQKQINNWFINQRKRHWKPSDHMHFSLMESLYGPFIPS
ncbi:hypothetical protein CDL15_Pgr014813 [Punica granatum]|uniref:Homeobox protein knotted-1-like 6 n=1 Tax=Punica granatum TaxID=22663 RepID=A0A218Y0E5_PUNGR|nr:hypothetical protein CDL15_Pgr014813 [Punica granatum]